MAICDDCFEEFLHPLVHESMEKNEGFRNKYGAHARWDWDYERSLITFSDPEKPLWRLTHPLLVPQRATRGNGPGQIETWSRTQKWTSQRCGSSARRTDMKSLRLLSSARNEYTGWEMTSVQFTS